MVQGESKLARELLSGMQTRLRAILRSVCSAVLLERKTDPLVFHSNLDHGGTTTQ